MSDSGTTEMFGMEEFPKMPKNYKGFDVSPSLVAVSNQYTFNLFNTIILQLNNDDFFAVKFVIQIMHTYEFCIERFG